MDKAQKKRNLGIYAYVLKIILLFFGIPIIIAPFFYNWILHSTATFNRIKFAVMGGSLVGANLVPSVPLKLLAATVHGVSTVLLLLGCFYFAKLLDYFRQAELFSIKTLNLYTKFMRVAFIWTLYEPISHTFLGLITTANNMPGHRILSVTIKGEDFIHVIIVGTLLIVNSLMQEAYKLKREQDLTV